MPEPGLGLLPREWWTWAKVCGVGRPGLSDLSSTERAFCSCMLQGLVVWHLSFNENRLTLPGDYFLKINIWFCCTVKCFQWNYFLSLFFLLYFMYSFHNFCEMFQILFYVLFEQLRKSLPEWSLHYKGRQTIIKNIITFY